MQFQMNRMQNSDRSVSVAVVAEYTEEEAGALTHFGAWEHPCLPEIRARLDWWRGDIVFNYPTYRHLVSPGILFDDFVPINADRFESRFQSEYGYWIQRNFSDILIAFRRENHYRLAQQRDDYFGARPLPHQTRYLPRS